MRKSERSGVTVESVSDPRLIDLFFPMVEEAYARHQTVSPHPERFYLWNGSPAAAVARRVVLPAWPTVQWWRYQLRQLADRVGARSGQFASTLTQQQDP